MPLIFILLHASLKKMIFATMMKIAQCIFIVDKLLLTFDVFMSFYPSFEKRRKFTIWMPTFCSVRWFLCGFLLHYSSTQAQKKGPTKKTRPDLKNQKKIDYLYFIFILNFYCYYFIAVRCAHFSTPIHKDMDFNKGLLLLFFLQDFLSRLRCLDFFFVSIFFQQKWK